MTYRTGVCAVLMLQLAACAVFDENEAPTLKSLESRRVSVPHTCGSSISAAT